MNTEIHSMNEEFSSHQNEQGDADDTSGGANASVDLDRSVEDQEEEVVMREYFDGSPCCALGGACCVLQGALLDPCLVKGESCMLGRRAWIWRRKN